MLRSTGDTRATLPSVGGAPSTPSRRAAAPGSASAPAAAPGFETAALHLQATRTLVEVQAITVSTLLACLSQLLTSLGWDHLTCLA